jgi:hypothetical protein
MRQIPRDIHNTVIGPAAVTFILAFITFVLGLTAYSILSDKMMTDRIADATTQMIRPLATPVVELLSSQSFVFVASAVIFLAAVVVALLYALRHVMPALSELRALQASMQAARAAPGAAQVLEGALRSTDNPLSKSRMLGAAWAAYQHYWRESGRLPADLFSDFAARDGARRARPWDMVMRALPGYFVSVGLILTFMGLVVALYLAARGMRHGGADEARAAIIGLLNVASFKFLTSVAAISGALILSVVWKVGSWRIQQTSRLAALAVDRLIEVGRPEAGINNALTAQGVMARLDRIIDLLVLQGCGPVAVVKPESKVTVLGRP